MSMLFDTSPIEDDDGKKKPRSIRPKSSESHAPAPVVVEEPSANYLASLDGQYECGRCGLTLLDLADTRGRKWLVQCGWGCGLLMLVDPVPGLLDKEDRKQDADAWRMRGGRFDGKTFAEIEAEGAKWYIESLVTTSKRDAVKEAAKKYLDRK
jgi:hypothetical protein